MLFTLDVSLFQGQNYYTSGYSTLLKKYSFLNANTLIVLFRVKSEGMCRLSHGIICLHYFHHSTV